MGVGAPETGLRAVVGAKLSRSMDRLVCKAIHPLIRRAAMPIASNPNGRRFVVLHLDGVSREVLLMAIRRGYTPFLGRLIGSKAYSLSAAYSGAPASTPAFQAGLLYGARHADIPGFNWYDRLLRREIRMDQAADALAVESVLQGRAEGLLREGSANFSVFTGGAPVNGYCRSGWAAKQMRFLGGRGWWQMTAALVAHSLTAANVLGRVFQEGGAALFDLIRQFGRVGRLQNEPTFFLHRLGLAVGAREAATWGTVLDIARGVPSLYTCFGDYDEIAHRRGPRSRIALLALWGIDRALARIFGAGAAVPQMAYDFYIIADHGQVETRPFENAAGLALVDYLALARLDGSGAPHVPDQVANAVNRYRAIDRATQALPRGMQPRARQAAFDVAQAWAHARGETSELPMLEEVVTIEAGDMAHIYLGKERRPLQVEEIERRYERILKILVRSPAIGFVVARGGRAGVAWFRGRRADLDRPSDAARLNIGYGGRRISEFLSQVVSMPSAGDLVVYGNGLEGQDDVAFPGEFGSHAGVACQEVETFVIHPAFASQDLSGIEHGADLHEYLVGTYGVGAT